MTTPWLKARKTLNLLCKFRFCLAFGQGVVKLFTINFSVIFFCIIVIKIITIFHDSFICVIQIMHLLCSNFLPLIQCGLS